MNLYTYNTVLASSIIFVTFDSVMCLYVHRWYFSLHVCIVLVSEYFIVLQNKT